MKTAFIHVPKTGGTSIRAVLESCGTVFPYQSYTMVPESDWDQMKEYDIVAGHFPVQLIDQHFCSDAKKITILRHPVERTISYYYWLKSVHAQMPEQIESLHHKKWPLIRHGLRTYVKEGAAPGQPGLDGMFLMYFSGMTPPYPDIEKAKQAAKQTLSSMFFVGFFDSIEADTDLLMDKLGFSRKPVPHLQKISKDNQEVTLDVVEMLYRRLPIDLEIYSCIKALWACRKRGEGDQGN